jgi:hypothetical protein
MLQAKYSVRVLADKGEEKEKKKRRQGQLGRNREIKYLLRGAAAQSESVISCNTLCHMTLI